MNRIEAMRVIEFPVFTEKTEQLGKPSKKGKRQYVFRVVAKANKFQIKKAIEALYKVKVERVHTINQKGEIKMGRGGKRRKVSGYRKAYITLPENQEISLSDLS